MAGFETSGPVLRLLADDAEAVGGDLRARFLDPAPAPDAGRSAGEIGAALTHLCNAVSDLARMCEFVATNLRDTADNYDRADAMVAAELERIARGGSDPWNA
jgi:hypothetical protein